MLVIWITAIGFGIAIVSFIVIYTIQFWKWLHRKRTPYQREVDQDTFFAILFPWWF